MISFKGDREPAFATGFALRARVNEKISNPNKPKMTDTTGDFYPPVLDGLETNDFSTQ
jgi:hypothetical protein